MVVAEFRCLLEAMTNELGDRTGYCFVKEQQPQPPGGGPQPAPEIVMKSLLLAKILAPYDGEASILRVCRRVFAREATRRDRGLSAIIGSTTLADISMSAGLSAATAAAAAAVAEAEAPPGLALGDGEGREGFPNGAAAPNEEESLRSVNAAKDTYFCLEERHPRAYVWVLLCHVVRVSHRRRVNGLIDRPIHPFRHPPHTSHRPGHAGAAAVPQVLLHHGAGVCPRVCLRRGGGGGGVRGAADAAAAAAAALFGGRREAGPEGAVAGVGVVVVVVVGGLWHGGRQRRGPVDVGNA